MNTSFTLLIVASIGFVMGCNQTDTSQGAGTQAARSNTGGVCQVSSADIPRFVEVVATARTTEDSDSLGLVGVAIQDSHEERPSLSSYVQFAGIPRCPSAITQTALDSLRNDKARLVPSIVDTESVEVAGCWGLIIETLSEGYLRSAEGTQRVMGYPSYPTKRAAVAAGKKLVGEHGSLNIKCMPFQMALK
jgi:hypothetical protein